MGPFPSNDAIRVDFKKKRFGIRWGPMSITESGRPEIATASRPSLEN